LESGGEVVGCRLAIRDVGGGWRASRTAMTTFCAAGGQRDLHLYNTCLSWQSSTACHGKACEGFADCSGPSAVSANRVVHRVGFYGLLRREPQFNLAVLPDPVVLWRRTFALGPGRREEGVVDHVGVATLLQLCLRKRHACEVIRGVLTRETAHATDLGTWPRPHIPS
jgi:hypothetical protein